jgi:hypothetical protein
MREKEECLLSAVRDTLAAMMPFNDVLCLGITTPKAALELLSGSDPTFINTVDRARASPLSAEIFLAHWKFSLNSKLSRE